MSTSSTNDHSPPDDGVQYGTLVMHVPVTYYCTNPSGSLAVHHDWAAYGVLPGLWLPDGRSVLPSMEEWHHTVTSQPSLGDLQQVLDTWLVLGYRPLIDMKQCTLDTVGGDPVVLRPHPLLDRKLPVTYDQILDYLSHSLGREYESTATTASHSAGSLRRKLAKSMTFRRHPRAPPIPSPSCSSSSSLPCTTPSELASQPIPPRKSLSTQDRIGGAFSRGTRKRW